MLFKSILKQRFCTVEKFKGLRIYRKHSLLQLTNLLFVNYVMSSRFLVGRSMNIYSSLCKLVGSTFVNNAINKTFGAVFLTGETLNDTTPYIEKFRSEKISSIIGYGAEGFIDVAAIESQLDINAEDYRKTAEQACRFPDQIIQIKLSGIADMDILKTVNSSCRALQKFFETNNKNDLLTGNDIYEALLKLDQTVTIAQVATFLKNVFGYTEKFEEFKCDEVEWKYSVHPLYIRNSAANSDHILHTITKLKQNTREGHLRFINRLDKILQPFKDHPNNLKVVFDAEQTYIQDAIFSLNQQYLYHFNKDKAYLIISLQNYLKKSPQKIKFYAEVCKRKDLCLAIKFVRGAYMIQERRIAQQQNYPSPIANSFEETTKNYYSNLNYAFNSNVKKGSLLIVASHNLKTAQEGLRLAKIPSDKTIYFAQIYGLADHLTFWLASEGVRIYKCLAFGKISINVPYLIRRAQQLSQMRYPLDLQRDLVYDEIKQRFWVQ